jgi:NADH-quinone oxidoreductase subunit G
VTNTEVETVTITVDGQPVEVPKGELVIEAAERADVYIPRFCYHSRMRPVGMCRQCVVEIDTGRGPALQPSCMIEATDGMTVETGTPVTIKAQTGILELLLINHPLDCPVCDKGGECPLQDQAMSHGPGESRMVEEKRHYEKPIPVSDLVALDRERCILCDRCTRFAKEVAGEPLIHFIDRGGQTQVNTFPDHPFASYYSGNTVQICPVGALTSVSYRFKARPWDLQTTETTCQGCAMGCRISVDTSRNRVNRHNGVDIDPVNWGWLCDKGRYGYQAIESDERLGAPLRREGDELVEARWSEALRDAATALDQARRADPGTIGVIGGARLPNEDAYAWAKLAKGVLGTDNVDAQMGDGLPAELVLGRPRATIDRLCQKGGTILWIGPDPREELAVLYLRLRHAVKEDGATLIAVTPTATALDGLATAAFHPAPGELAGLVTALLEDGPVPDGVDTALVDAARTALGADDLSVAIGRGSVAESAGFTVDAAAVVARARPEAPVLPLLRRANVNGALDMGLAPGILPGRTTLDGGRDALSIVWDGVPETRGLDTTGILTAAAEGRISVLVLLGADPLADHPDRELATRALAGARTVIATDLFLTESSSRADIVFPVAGPDEVDGTHTNVEGRISVLDQAVTAPGTARPDWMVAAELALRLGSDLGVESRADLWAEIEAVAPTHRGITAELLAAAGDGVVAPLGTAVSGTTEVTSTGEAVGGSDAHPAGDADAPDVEQDEGPEPSGEGSAEGDNDTVGAEGEADADQAHVEGDATEGGGEAERDVVAGGADDDDAAAPAAIRFEAPEPTPVPPVDSYALRLVVSRTLFDDGTLVQQTPILAPLAAEAPLRVHPAVLERLGVATGTTVRVVSPRATITAPVVADPGVPRTVAAVSRRRTGGLSELVDQGGAVTEIRLETV